LLSPVQIIHFLSYIATATGMMGNRALPLVVNCVIGKL